MQIRPHVGWNDDLPLGTQSDNTNLHIISKIHLTHDINMDPGKTQVIVVVLPAGRNMSLIEGTTVHRLAIQRTSLAGGHLSPYDDETDVHYPPGDRRDMSSLRTQIGS